MEFLAGSNNVGAPASVTTLTVFPVPGIVVKLEVVNVDVLY